jgi:hypothetical protein
VSDLVRERKSRLCGIPAAEGHGKAVRAIAKDAQRAAELAIAHRLDALDIRNVMRSTGGTLCAARNSRSRTVSRMSGRASGRLHASAVAVTILVLLRSNVRTARERAIRGSTGLSFR